MLTTAVLLLLQVPVALRSATGRWIVKSDVSRMTDTKTVSASLHANTPISGWPRKTVTPTLVLRCKEGDVEAYVVTGMAPNVESGNLDGPTVMVRFDKEPAREANTSQSTDKESLFFKDAKDLILEMEGRDTLVFRFTPFNSSPQETTFTLRGLTAAAKSLKTACGWDPAKDKADEAAAVEDKLAKLKNPDADVRMMAASDLRFVDDDHLARAITGLIEALNDQSSYVRVNAATALGSFRGRAKDAIPALEAAAQRTDDERLVVQAKAALAKIRAR